MKYLLQQLAECNSDLLRLLISSVPQIGNELASTGNQQLLKKKFTTVKKDPNCQQWFVRGKLHREEGPAVTWWHRNGTIKRKAWYEHHKLHREGGPAVTWWSENGTKDRREWYEDGKLWRTSYSLMVV